jgi:hypothetical protein
MTQEDPMDAPQIRENLEYEIINPTTGQVFLPPPGRHWRFEKETTERLISEGRIIFGRNGTARPAYKRFLSEAKEKGSVATTLWDDVSTTTEATKMLFDMFDGVLSREAIGKIKPKPVELIHRIVYL